MKKTEVWFVPLLIVCCLSFVSACGLAASNEERVARAAAQVDEGEYRKAMIELKNVLGSDANNAEARLLLAKVSLGLGDVLSAEKELERAIELDAPESDVRPLYMEILLAKGASTEVLAALGMETTGLTQAQQWSYRGRALLTLGNVESAAATYTEWLDAEPDSVDAAVGLAEARAALGDIDAAIASLREQVAIEPDNFTAWQVLGNALFRAGDYAGAEAALISAADTIQPQAHVSRYALILASLTEVELILDKRDAARRNLERLSGVAPNAPITLFLSARLARADGDFALAARQLQQLLNVSPDNTQAQVFLANMQLFQGNLAQAERLLQRVIATSPDNLQARKLLAQVQLRQSQPAGAVEALAPMLDGDSQDDDVYTLLAQASLQQGDMGGAIIQLQKAVELDPENMDAKLNLASAYLNMGSTDLALELLDQVPEGAGSANQRERLMMAALVADGRQDAADAIATNLLAGSDSDPASTAIVVDHYIRTKRVEQAKQILEQFIGNNPDQLDPKNALARVELSSGNLDAARDLFESVVASDASNLIALLGLSAIAEQAGEMQRMIELLQTAAETNREAAAPRALLARYYLAQGEVVEAENYANELVLIGSQNARINSVVANVLIAAGRLEEALTYAEKAALVASGSAEAQLGLARAQLALNQTTDAREALKRALEISPGLPRAMTLLTLLELREGNTEEANTLVAQLRSQYPDDLAGMVLEGEVLQAQEQYALAAEAFRRAADNGAGRSAMLREYQARVDGQLPQPEATLARWLSEQPDDAVARSFLAQHYQRQQEADRAIQEYQKVLDQDPDNAVVLNNLAWEYQQIGDLDRAAELAEKAFALQGSSGSIADTLGWIYYEQGQFDKSVEMLSTASQLSPNNGEIQYHYAAALSATGDSEAARGLLQQLKDKNVQFPSRQLADELLESL